MKSEIVIDVGSAEWGTERSIEALITRFHPRLLIGFDPVQEKKSYSIADTKIEIIDAAAWNRSGVEPLWGSGTRATLIEPHPTGSSRQIKTVDLAVFIRDLAESVILKLDCEGAEYTLISHLIATDVIRQVEAILVEWHQLEFPTRMTERQTFERVLGELGVGLELWS